MHAHPPGIYYIYLEKWLPVKQEINWKLNWLVKLPRIYSLCWMTITCISQVLTVSYSIFYWHLNFWFWFLPFVCLSLFVLSSYPFFFVFMSLSFYVCLCILISYFQCKSHLIHLLPRFMNIISFTGFPSSYHEQWLFVLGRLGCCKSNASNEQCLYLIHVDWPTYLNNINQGHDVGNYCQFGWYYLLHDTVVNLFNLSKRKQVIYWLLYFCCFLKT